MSDRVQGFTEAQVQEMATRGAALDCTRPSDWWRRAEDLPDAALVDSVQAS